MEKGFFWISAKEIPYRGYIFFDSIEELIVNGHEENLSDRLFSLFQKLQKYSKKGLYALGFVSYEAGYLLEKRLLPLYKTPFYPLVYFKIFKKCQKLKINPLSFQPQIQLRDLKFLHTEEEYQASIEKIKDFIAKGHTYQVNFTTKLKFLYEGDFWELFLELLFSQRCEYACFIQEKDWVLLSLSPELFVRKKGHLIESEPMKGTLQREFLQEIDQKRKLNLKKEEKYQAENIMIVDLIRNDFGRICKLGSVWVKKLFSLKTYPTLHQMVSRIQGSLKRENLFLIFQALFPCGSVTGAPKIRTMEILAELEKEPRNIYTGAIGYLDPQGNFTFNVAIRTLLLKSLGEKLYQGELGIGSGIVWDSEPKKEYEETLLKANFLLNPIPYFEIFETFSWEKEKINPLLFFHYQRLLSSAQYFKFKIPKELRSFQNFSNFLQKNLEAKSSLRVKVSLSPEGDLKVLQSPISSPGWGQEIRIGLIKRKTAKNLWHFHKTTLREEYDLWRKKGEELGLTEIVFYDEQKNLLEGTISNVFLKIGREYLTPPLE